MRQGYAKRNRGNGILNWAYLTKQFPAYREHIFRIRKNYEKLVGLRNKLVAKYGQP
jgi:hypothetical protein